eukprot:4916255-Pleurochrysis_carterae.AAC.1
MALIAPRARADACDRPLLLPVRPQLHVQVRAAAAQARHPARADASGGRAGTQARRARLRRQHGPSP